MNTGARPPRPVPFQGDLHNLPDALAPLKKLPNWVCWRWEWRDDKKGVGKWTKPPFRPDNPTIYAKNNDPATWGTYEQALTVFEGGKCDGIGFNLSGTDIAAFDIDKCRDPATGDIAPEAMAIVDRATSYMEITVSGTGLRVIGCGTGATVHRRQKLPSSPVEVESYRGAERYIVITGNPLPSTWPHLANIDREIDAVVAELDGRKDGAGQNGKDDAGQDDEFASRPQAGNGDAGDAFLPYELVQLIERGVPPDKDLSAAFHHAVCWLRDLGWSAARIEARITGKPIVPDRYEGRLRQEIDRCLLKAKDKKAEQGARADKDKTEQSQEGAQPYEVFWHGNENDDELVSWLVKDLIFENGTGLASGPWGAAKSFVVLDLAASIATATPFAGREVVRQGGVLFVAAEGANQVRIRLEGVVEEKLRPAGEASGQPIAAVLPFGWIEDCPNLQDDGEFARLVATAKYVAGNIHDQFDLPLVLIVIDTLSATGSFKDANDAAEGQRVMNRLAELNRQTRAFVLAVDHFGKAAEAGTRGTTAKEAAADIILALLADREINGKISNTRMALRKLRGGQVGIETPFSLKVVDMGMGQTTCIVEWQADGDLAQAARERWPKSLRIFKSALTVVLIEQGKPMRPYGSEGPEVRAVTLDAVRHEFTAAYPADASDDPKDAKRKAFTRALKDARGRELIGSREIGGIDYLWLVADDPAEPTNTTAGRGARGQDEPDIQADKPDTP